MTSGATAEVELRLFPGGGLEGVIQTADGAPATGATVYVGGYGGFESHQAKVGHDGRYSVDALAPGAHSVHVSSREKGKAAGNVDIEEGAIARWDATLVSGSSAKGRVVDDSGAPLAGWRVGAEGTRGLWHSNVTTNDDGRFVLENIPKAATTLAVGPADVWTTGPSLHLPGRLPTDEELLLVVPANAMPNASVRALLRGAGVEVTGEATLSLNSFSPWTFRDAHPDAEGRVEAGRIRPGTYSVRVSAPGAAPLHLETTIEANEEHDLGELVLTPGGKVSVKARAANVESDALVVQLKVRAQDGRTAGYIDVSAGRGESQPLAQGTYTLRARGRFRTQPDVLVEIETGETGEIPVDLEAAVARAIELRALEGTTFPKAYALRVTDAAGEVYDERPMDSVWGEAKDKWTTVVAGLVPGRWTVEATADDGRAGSVTFVVDSLEPVDAPEVIELR